MSRGPGRLQRAILDFMQHRALYQRTPQRERFQVETFLLHVIRRDPVTGQMRPMTGRQLADARKRIRRACASLVAAGLIVRFGFAWALLPETPQEARVRRKRFRISERAEREQQQRQRASSWVLDSILTRPIDRTMRQKLVKVLGQLGSDNDNVVVMAARQAERLRNEGGHNWNDLIAT